MALSLIPEAPHIKRPDLATYNYYNIKSKKFMYNTAFIIDWDDTLLASSYITISGIDLYSERITQKMHDELVQLEDQLIVFLQNIINTKFPIFIITNAEKGWVELSSMKFIPRVHQLITDVKSNIHIMSARSTYRNLCPNDPNRWKKNAMIACVMSRFKYFDEMNLISFGDSECERNAILNCGSICVNAKIK
jgi:hypothetical protein